MIDQPPPNRLKAAVWAKTNGRCYWCHCEMNPFINFTLDHIKPSCSGGLTTVDNLMPACCSCNNARGSMKAGRWQAQINKRVTALAEYSQPLKFVTWEDQPPTETGWYWYKYKSMPTPQIGWYDKRGRYFYLHRIGLAQYQVDGPCPAIRWGPRIADIP